MPAFASSLDIGGGPSRLAVVGAASSIGIRPYEDSGEARRLDLAAGVLRELGLLEQLAADDLGDIVAPPYVDYAFPPGGIRNEAGLVEFSERLADRVAAALQGGRFPLVLGGDCSVLLGSLLAVSRCTRPVGLAYLDAHADFVLAGKSLTGSAAGMALALAVGRGDTPLARLSGRTPLVRGTDVVLIGRRDESDPAGLKALTSSGVFDIPGDALRTRGPVATADAALRRLARDGLRGFWVHFDADLLDPSVLPAVDSPEPGGPGLHVVTTLLTTIVTHPRALGMQVTIYDPALDPDRSSGRQLVALLREVLARRLAATDTWRNR